MADESVRGTAGLFSAVSDYLGDVEYPCTKAELVEHAASQGAPEMVLDAIQRLPDQEYLDFAQVTARFSQVNP